MTFAWFVQMTVDEVIDVIAVRHRVMSATFTVGVSCVMSFTVMIRGASCGSRVNVLIDMVIVHMVQMSIMQVVDMVVMLYGWVAAAVSVMMIVPFVCLTSHFFLLDLLPIAF